MYAHDTSSSRKSCLKLYQIYLNMANSRLRECRIKFTDKMLCVQKHMYHTSVLSQFLIKHVLTLSF